jgi:hypothetical protein
LQKTIVSNAATQLSLVFRFILRFYVKRVIWQAFGHSTNKIIFDLSAFEFDPTNIIAAR